MGGSRWTLIFSQFLFLLCAWEPTLWANGIIKCQSECEGHLSTCLMSHDKEQDKNLLLSKLDGGKFYSPVYLCTCDLTSDPRPFPYGLLPIPPLLLSQPQALLAAHGPRCCCCWRFLSLSQCISICEDSSWLLPSLLGPNKMFLHGKLSLEFREAEKADLISYLICCKMRGKEERSPF